MNNTFSNDLYQLIRKHLPGINSEAFYDSLIKSTKSSKTGNHQRIDLKAFYSEAVPGNSQYREFRRSILRDKGSISALYGKYIREASENKETESMLIDLFYRYLAENTSRFFGPFSRQHLKNVVFKNTMGREEDASQLRDLLNEHHKIIMYGNPGIGKSRFIRYFLTKYKRNDYYYISYDNAIDLKTNLHKIQYQDSLGSTYYGSEYELMSEDYSSSLLIIDHMYLPHDPSHELELLAKFNVNILVVTLSPVRAGSFFLYELPQLSRDNLLQIFKRDSGFPISDNLLQERLLTVTGQNALMISLVAKLCKKALGASPGESPSTILKTALTQLEYPDNHMDNGKLPVFRHKHEYTGYDKTLDIIGHIKTVSKKLLEYMDPAAKDYLKWLCCFGSCHLPLDFVSCLIPNCQKSMLKMLHNMGFIDLSNGMLQLSPLISYSVFADQNPNPNGKEFVDITRNLMRFLQTYDETLSVPYLSNALLTFIKTLYKRVPYKHYPDQKTVAEQYENWQELISMIYNYYHQSGDYYIAEEVASSIYYPELKSMHSFLDAASFHLGNAMQMESCFQKVPEMIDSLCKDINDNSKQAANTNLNYFLINAMDTCIGFYCHDLLKYHGKSMEPSNYQQHMRRVVEKIVLQKKQTTNHTYWQEICNIIPYAIS